MGGRSDGVMARKKCYIAAMVVSVVTVVWMVVVVVTGGGGGDGGGGGGGGDSGVETAATAAVGTSSALHLAVPQKKKEKAASGVAATDCVASKTQQPGCSLLSAKKQSSVPGTSYNNSIPTADYSSSSTTCSTQSGVFLAFGNGGFDLDFLWCGKIDIGRCVSRQGCWVKEKNCSHRGGAGGTRLSGSADLDGAVRSY